MGDSDDTGQVQVSSGGPFHDQREHPLSATVLYFDSPPLGTNTLALLWPYKLLNFFPIQSPPNNAGQSVCGETPRSQ